MELVENTNLILEVIYFLGIHHLATQCHPINNLMNYCTGDKFLLEIRKRIELSHKIMSIKMELPILHKKILNSTFCVGIVSLPRPLMMNITTHRSSNCTRLKTGLYSLDIPLILFSKNIITNDMKNMKEKLVNHIMYLAHSQRSNGYSTIMGMRKITQEIMKAVVVQCLLIPHLIHKSQCQVVMTIMKMTLHLTKIQMHRWSMEINSMIRSKSTEITGTSLQLLALS